MSIRFVTMVITLIMLPSIILAQDGFVAKPPSGIELLRSTKEDLKRFKNLEISTGSAAFRDGKFRYEAVIAEDRCFWHGWNVKPGTILSLRILLDEKVSIDRMIEKEEVTFQFENDTQGRTYLSKSNDKKFYVDSAGRILSVTILPSSSNTSRRCDGYPPFDPLWDSFRGYEFFELSSMSNWRNDRLTDFAQQLRDSEDLYGTVFIYFLNGSEVDATRLKQGVQTFLSQQWGIQESRVTIALGGGRDSAEIVTFLTPSSSRQPLPRPKYSSPSIFPRKRLLEIHRGSQKYK